MTSKRAFNRQQSVICTPGNFRSNLAIKEIEEPVKIVHTDYIPENKKTSNDMIFMDRPPDLTELFEDRKGTTDLFFDNVWSGQFYRVPEQGNDEVGSDQEDMDDPGALSVTLGGTHTYSRGISNVSLAKNRQTRFTPDPQSNSRQSRASSTIPIQRATMVLQERYDDAIRKTWERGYTQEMLLKRMRSKLSEKVENYGTHRIRLRKKFQYFDKDQRGALLEGEFKEFVDMSNCYFDEVESLALFAYLDEDGDGHISWTSFDRYCIVRDSSSGNALQPKAITHQM